MTALPEELISQLCDLITRLREESAAYQENHEDGQLWYNRGYANGMVKGLVELLADQQPCGLSLDDQADLQGHEVMAWGQAYRHGEQMGYKETFEIAGQK